MTAKKHDSGKPKLSLLPLEALISEARALEYGTQKYGKGNYKHGFNYSRLLDATLRHLFAYIGGEDTDPESGVSHLGHARANLGMLLHNVENKVGNDDR